MDNIIDEVTHRKMKTYLELAYVSHTQHQEAHGEIENIIDKYDEVHALFL